MGMVNSERKHLLAADWPVEQQGQAQPQPDGQHHAADDEEQGDKHAVLKAIVPESPNVVLQADELPGLPILALVKLSLSERISG